jgi:(p)ppGpp synthase/HD superfamily hydrolase
MEDILKKITDFADQAHGEQTRKFTPERYIVHPIRVMEICRKYTNDIAVLAAALLHDVLEDTPVTKENIHDFLVKVMDKEDAIKTVTLVEELTDIYIKSDYPQWNRRKRKAKEAERLGKTSADSQTVKYADIIDNSSEIVNHKTSFAHVYLYESRALLRKMTQGDYTLYQRALETVDKCIEQLGVK